MILNQNSPEVKRILLGNRAITNHIVLCWSVPPSGHHGSSKKEIKESGSSHVFPDLKNFDKNILWFIILAGFRRIAFYYWSHILGGLVWGRKVPLGSFPWSPSRFLSVFIFSKSPGRMRP